MEKFERDLKHINPEFLMNKNDHDKVETFFVRLGIVFNDMHSLIVFEMDLEKKYYKPGNDEITSHAGEYGGLKAFIQKSMASVIHEFFELLNKNSPVFKTKEFQEVLSKIPKLEQDWWKNLVLASQNKFDKVSGMLESIFHIRNTIGFHFDHSGKNIRNAFVSRFFRDDKTEKNDKAYYSIGKDNLDTRFYFSDAVVEEILYLDAGKRKNEKLAENEEWKVYQTLLHDTVQTIGDTIRALLSKHLRNRRNKPKKV